MHFRISLQTADRAIPINYQYPLSAAIYKILAKGEAVYAEFLHDIGYGKGFKFFTFSQLNFPFKISENRLLLQSDEVNFEIAFHMPEATENFIKGLFQSEYITIANKNTKAVFQVKSVETLADPLKNYKENELVDLSFRPLSPVVAGIQNEKGNYTFLAPEDPRFTDSLIYNWRSKIAACYDEETAAKALILEICPIKQPFKSRLLTIKEGTPQETKIRGWMNFKLKATAERRFVDILLDCGCGIYNSMGCGFLNSISN